MTHRLCEGLAWLLARAGRYRHIGKKNLDLATPDNPEGRYLDRYALLGYTGGDNEGGRYNVWLHRVWREDGDRDPHDHPWHSAGALILSGGYVEDRDGQWRVLEPGDVNLLPGGVFHRIVVVHRNTWTLFITGPTHGRSWGFLRGGVRIPWKTYLNGRA